jgi:hypothetical protein
MICNHELPLEILQSTSSNLELVRQQKNKLSFNLQMNNYAK